MLKLKDTTRNKRVKEARDRRAAFIERINKLDVDGLRAFALDALRLLERYDETRAQTVVALDMDQRAFGLKTTTDRELMLSTALESIIARDLMIKREMPLDLAKLMCRELGTPENDLDVWLNGDVEEDRAAYRRLYVNAPSSAERLAVRSGVYQRLRELFRMMGMATKAKASELLAEVLNNRN